MIDLRDFIHYIIGALIVSFALWLMIKTNNYFSKDNKPLEAFTTSTKRQPNNLTT